MKIYNSKIMLWRFHNSKIKIFHIHNSKTMINWFHNSKIMLRRFHNSRIKLLKIHNFIIILWKCDRSDLNPFVFKTLNYLLINGNLEYIEEDSFENFNEIRYISIKSDSLMNFFHRGTKWMNSINRNLNVSLENQFEFRNNVH